ncbi:MAG: hypothetical protein PHI36_07290 [Bacteroidales bacterium]|nr:hypothetical protein [Bacteroidales bacterium]
MKNIISNKGIKLIAINSVLLFVIVMQSCSLNEHEYDYKLNIPDEYNQVGELHNQGLDYVFKALKRNAIENSKESDTNLKSAEAIDYDTIITEATYRFCKKNKKLKADTKIYEALMASSKKESIHLRSSRKENLNQKQQELMNEINEALKIKFSNESLLILKNKLTIINQKASKELTEIEAAPIYCGTSTAYCTYQYWQKNYRKWYFMINYPEILQQYKEDKQLNSLSLKSRNVSLRSSWLDDMFNTVEDWFTTSFDSVSTWWNTYGSTVCISDGVGAVWGAGAAISTVGSSSLVFGPTGIVVTTTGGAVYGAIEASAQGLIGCAIYSGTN